jgi:hypothetical protein
MTKKTRAQKKTYRFRFAAGLAVGVTALAGCKSDATINTAPVEQPQPNVNVVQVRDAENTNPATADAGSTDGSTAEGKPDTGANLAPPKRVNTLPPDPKTPKIEE